MHEAGIAAAIAGELRERGLDARSVVLRVSDGHGDPAAFDAALRMHLAAIEPGLDVLALVIEHVPTARLCASCTGSFQAVGPDDPCPACGGPGIAVPLPERVDMIVAEPTPRGER